jgi:hypothetical protein
MPAGWIPDLKQTGKLLEGKTVAHRSRPFGQSARHLAPVVDAPIHPTRQRYPTLLPTRKAGASTRLDHATVSGFGSFDGMVTAHFHDVPGIARFHWRSKW